MQRKTPYHQESTSQNIMAVILQSLPKEADVAGTFFDTVLGETVVFARKPWILVQEGEDFELAEKIGWRVRVRKAPQNMAPIEILYKTLGETVSQRTKFYREVGDKIFRHKLSEQTEASLLTLGGFAEVGRSCMLLATRESKIILDCGLNLSAKDSLTATPRFDIAGIGMEDVDAVVLSHAHLDHTGFLPALFKYGYKGPIYCTEPTLLLMSMLQRDYVRHSSSDALYSERDIDSAVTHTITLMHGIVTDISPDVKLVLSNSGHIIGSTSIHLHIGNGDHNLVYTSDMKFGRTFSLENASWNFPRVETMIIEGTYGGKEDVFPYREETDMHIIDSINKTIAENGKVLIPLPAVGMSQELILYIDKYMKAGKITQTKVLVEKIISDATSIHEAYPEYLSKEIKYALLQSQENPFQSKQFVIIESETLRKEEPAIILAPSSMLIGGPSVEYLEQISEGPENRLILASFQAVGTPGRNIQNGSRQVVINGRNIKINCQV